MLQSHGSPVPYDAMAMIEAHIAAGGSLAIPRKCLRNLLRLAAIA